jgi:hypothetical protein
MRNLPLLTDLACALHEGRGEEVDVSVNLPTTPISTVESDWLCTQLQVFVARLDAEDHTGAPHPLVKGCTLAEGEAGPGRWAFKDAVPF